MEDGEPQSWEGKGAKDPGGLCPYKRMHSHFTQGREHVCMESEQWHLLQSFKLEAGVDDKGLEDFPISASHLLMSPLL